MRHIEQPLVQKLIAKRPKLMPYKKLQSDYSSRGRSEPRAKTHKYVENSDQAAKC